MYIVVDVVMLAPRETQVEVFLKDGGSTKRHKKLVNDATDEAKVLANFTKWALDPDDVAPVIMTAITSCVQHLAMDIAKSTFYPNVVYDSLLYAFYAKGSMRILVKDEVGDIIRYLYLDPDGLRAEAQ